MGAASTTRILVVSPDDASPRAIRRALSGVRTVVGWCRDRAALGERVEETRPDLAVVSGAFPSGKAARIAQELRRSHRVPTLLLASRSDGPGLVELVNDAVMGVIFEPLESAEVEVAIRAALGRHAELMRAERRAESLRATLGERKVVERAKGVLMVRHSLCEDDAHHLLQRRATRARESLSEVATRIVREEEMRSRRSAAIACEPLRFDGHVAAGCAPRDRPDIEGSVPWPIEA